MEKMMLIKRSVLIIGLAVAFALNSAAETLRYSGRNDLSDPAAPVLYWPGASVQARFDGTSLGVTLADSPGGNFYNAIIDGDEAAPVVIDCKPGAHTYAVASNLTSGVHEVLLFRRTEGTSGPTVFLGFQLDNGCTLQPLPPPLSRRIEFYGDSITCGMGNEAPDDGPDNINAQRNNYLAYGAVTARNLGADYRCIARSGIGIIKSWFDLTMPDYWYRLNPADPAGRWDFSTWTPDVVVVNLFQNDCWLTPKMNPVPTPDQIVQAYLDFVSGIRDIYPEAHIVCALGCMNATKEDSPWPDYIHQAVIQMEDSNLSECIFPFTGWSKHPRVRHHQAMADQLTEHIRRVMKWE
jgi:hypothetical protein